MSPRILTFDIETKPILGYVWGLWENNLGLEQVKEDWCIMSWAAKWYKEPHVMYMDNRRFKDLYDDKNLLKGIWKLLDEADIVITQNGKKFDVKKLNARFIMSGMKPPSSYKHIDTCQLAGKIFGFTSNKLAYMSEKINKKYKKLDHKKFPGISLWLECMAGNQKAWKEMELYNKHDVLATEELYTALSPWDNSVNLEVFQDSVHNVCKCGGKDVKKYGFAYTNTGKFQRFQCLDCGTEMRGRLNLLQNKSGLRVGTNRG